MEEKKQHKKIEDFQEKSSENSKEINKIPATAIDNKIKEEKKPTNEEKKIVKKDHAIVRGLDLPISVKNAIYTCEYIKGKKIDEAIHMLEEVLKKKAVLPMRGEIPHRKNGIVGRWPEKSTKVFIKLLKSLNANAQMAGIENAYIHEGISNLASRPHKRGGSQRFKRSHVLLTAREKKI